MKLSRPVFLILVLLIVPVVPAQTGSKAERAWKPFFTAFRTAVKNRDREALSKLMAKDFYYLSSGGDDNGNKDTRDEAFEYWASTNIGVWEALEEALAKGAVVNTAMREPGSRAPSRISPPLANNKKAIKQHSFAWYAVFEFRGDRWYCTAINQCCD